MDEIHCMILSCIARGIIVLKGRCTVYAFIPFEQGIQVFEAFIGTQISNKYAVHVKEKTLSL